MEGDDTQSSEAAALEIGRQTGGELFAIKTASDYPVSHSECSAIAEEEMKSDARPELACGKENSAAESRETGTKRGFSALAACGQFCDFCGR